jgi:squalene-hopene/tetraprenyl-beta-curcumene cyclase
MILPSFHTRLDAAYQTARAALLAERTPDGHWEGKLSASALSTAVAISALALVRKGGSRSSFPRSAWERTSGRSASGPQPRRDAERRSLRSHAERGNEDAVPLLIDGGLAWLAAHQNEDGGWGDTVRSSSNISTTMLCRAAFHLTDAAERFPDTLRRAESWLHQRYGKTPAELAEAVRRRYGTDHTFSVPILLTSALASLVPWNEVPPLPFELACFPQSWFRFLHLRVVSYALPALIAIGQAVYHHRPPRNPFLYLVRRAAIQPSLRVLTTIQPSSGGFLEATPLTSFVTLSLASIGRADHPVAQKAVEFLVHSVRSDGSWPIDTNLATWVTTLSVNALAAGGDLDSLAGKDALLSWLLKQQYLERHPYTGADPGGWAWTDLPGGVPDCDDTPGALLAIRHLLGAQAPAAVEDLTRRVYGPVTFSDANVPQLWERKEELGNPAFHVVCGLAWVRTLQNRDGGWPTFCSGWGNLPFDRSGSDLTAHALRALRAWVHCSVATGVVEVLNESLNLGASIPTPRTFQRVAQRGLAYLARHQRPDGSWLPLWFGNQHASDDENPTYGTARVLAAYRDLTMMNSDPARRGVAWLLSAQNADGGWGGTAGAPSSVEETALAVEVLLDAGPDAEHAVNNGLAWLVQEVEAGGLENPAPIGFYFAKLWYFEKLYPIIFTVAALGRARRKRS